MNDVENDKHYTSTEAAGALSSLEPKVLSRLQAIARAYSAGFPDMSADDLLQEAFTRILDGRRKWPKNVDAPKFIGDIIGSISSAFWKGLAREDSFAKVRPESHYTSTDDEDDNSGGVIQDFPDYVSSPEYEVFAEGLEKQIRDAFKDDEEGELILEAMHEGFTGKETMDLLDLGEKEYSSANRRVRRKLYQLLEGGKDG